MLSSTHAFIYSAIALWLLTAGGNWGCRALFSLSGLKDSIAVASDDTPPAGRLIGWFERLIISAGIIAQSWEILAAVIALKTVARFKDLDEKISAEYFLVGSLFSIFWAMVITFAWQAYDHKIGIDLQKIAMMIRQDASQLECNCNSAD